MTIKLLGTGAADGIPGLYSDTEVSRIAREHGGKDVRTRSAAVVDTCLKIDLPPETHTQCVRDRVDPREWTGLVFTHSHDDHFCASEVQYFLYPFNENELMPFTIYGNAEILRKLEEMYPDWPIDAIETRSFQPYCHAGYRITPFKAKHKEDEDSQNLLIAKDGKAFAYATDTGWWDEPTWEFLATVDLDLLVIECTEGFCSTDYAGHLDLKQCVEVVKRLRTQGTLKENARVVTTHHSHQGGGTHAQLERALSPNRIEVGYDGMQIAI
jgi:phosphoribosyl 1,2-cyclic phosphate phosphodiesterase